MIYRESISLESVIELDSLWRAITINVLAGVHWKKPLKPYDLDRTELVKSCMVAKLAVTGSLSCLLIAIMRILIAVFITVITMNLIYDSSFNWLTSCEYQTLWSQHNTSPKIWLTVAPRRRSRNGRWLKGWLPIVNYTGTGWLIDTFLILCCIK